MKSSGYQHVWQTVADIPRGRVATYGQIARLAGLPGRARFVGYALHNTPEHMDIPWHRVINGKGMISFPVDSEPYNLQMDKLAEEGIEFIDRKVDLERFGWQPSLDELLWKPRD